MATANAAKGKLAGETAIVTAAGNDAFCAGRDIKGLDYENNLDTAGYRAYVRANHEMWDDFENIEKPMIAAVNGICAGGGAMSSPVGGCRYCSSSSFGLSLIVRPPS